MLFYFEKSKIKRKGETETEKRGFFNILIIRQLTKICVFSWY